MEIQPQILNSGIVRACQVRFLGKQLFCDLCLMVPRQCLSDVVSDVSFCKLSCLIVNKSAAGIHHTQT